jgi:prepilin-type N-terminal cleavage/methylation domain-containing protein
MHPLFGRLARRLGRRLAHHHARAHRGMTLLEIMIVLAIIAIVMGLLVGPAVLRNHRHARVETTRMQLKMYAFQAYPSWSTSHPGKPCPDSLAELDPYMNKNETADAWGTPLTMLCGTNAPGPANGFGVSSAGEDQKPGTPDDLHSWE